VQAPSTQPTPEKELMEQEITSDIDPKGQVWLPGVRIARSVK
jgi:hypothetical protein